MEISLQHRIRERAYEIWNPEGRITAKQSSIGLRQSAKFWRK
jgi:hypothetical protein